MTDLITVTGVVGSDPRAIVAGEQLPITSFRLASSRRYFNRATGTWEDAGTNWYTVSAFRHLAFNANASLRKGEHVVVHGRLKQRPWQAGDKSGVAIEIEADAIGHDLAWGITQLRRLEQRPRPDAGEDAEAASGSHATGSAEFGSVEDSAEPGDPGDLDGTDDLRALDELDDPEDVDDLDDLHDPDDDEDADSEVSVLAGLTG